MSRTNMDWIILSLIIILGLTKTQFKSMTNIIIVLLLQAEEYNIPWNIITAYFQSTHYTNQPIFIDKCWN